MNTALVSVMHANNEVGTLQPIPDIAAITRTRGILLHTDAAQSVGKMPVNVEALGVDLLTIAGHKFNAPRGLAHCMCGAGTPIRPILHGAEQEHGLRRHRERGADRCARRGVRAGFGRSIRTAGSTSTLRDRLHERLAAGVPGLQLNGHPEHRLPNTLHVSFPGVAGRAVLADAADVVAASLGSACHSEQDTVSGVLAAMGIDAARASGAVRLSVGRTTSADDIDHAARALVASWARLAQR